MPRVNQLQLALRVEDRFAMYCTIKTSNPTVQLGGGQDALRKLPPGDS